MEANLHEVVDPGKQLGVDGEPAVELVPRLGNQPLSKLTLEHEDCTPGKMAPLYKWSLLVTKAGKLA